MSARAEYFMSLANQMVEFKYFDAFATILAVAVFFTVCMLAILSGKSKLDHASKLPLED